MRSSGRQALRFFSCLVTLLICLGMTQAFGQAPEDETPGVPGVPPGVDVGRRPGVGEPPVSQGKLQDTRRNLQDLTNDGKFDLVEATIDDIHAALQKHEITCLGLVRSYLNRIKTYGGQCVSYDKDGDGKLDYDLFMPSGKGVILGVVNALPNAKKVNAISTINLRPSNYASLGFGPPDGPGPRSETDLLDNMPHMPDALEVAAQLDAEFKSTNHLRPLMCIPIVIKDQMETFDMRTTDGSLTQFLNDRPPNDGTLVAKLRAAGAIIIGKANMDEYAGGSHRSSYGGPICNPYATDRDGGSSSTGSASAPSANLAVCGIAEESGGSIHMPASKQGIVGMTPSRGLVSRFGSWPAELIRERYGPECRTVADEAKVLDVIRGYDSKDAITATQVGYTPEVSLDNYAHATTLKGKRLGIVREFMPKVTVNDADAIRVFNEEVIPLLKSAGAELVESVNPRDIANGWAVDDPSIPNMSIQDILADMIPTLEPSFANPSSVPSPSTTTGLLPSNLRTVFGSNVPALFPPGTDIIQKSVEMAFDHSKFPDTINLRKLSANGAGTLNQGRYGLDKMLQRRNDPQIKSVLDLSIDFNDLNHNGDRTEHLSYFMVDGTGTTVQRSRPGVSPGAGVPATANGSTLDTQGEANHLFRMQAIREIVARILADNQLDALVYPMSTLPPKILTGTPNSIAWAAYDGRPASGYNAFTDGSGLPAISVPAGYTKVVYDRTGRGTTEADALNPPAIRREVSLPFSIVFLSRLWSEPTLLEIASAYERARGPRIPPPDFSDEPPVPATSVPSTKTAPASSKLAPSNETASDAASTKVIRAAENTSSSGVAILDLRQDNVLISETSVSMSQPMRSGRVYAELTDRVNTGLAIANPNDSAATFTFSFTDTTGDLKSDSMTIPAKSDIATFLNQAPYNAPSGFQGTFSFTSDVPVGVTAFRGLTNERNESLISTLPVIGTADKLQSETTVLPYFAEGAGWRTEVVLINPTDNDIAGAVQFSDATGKAKSLFQYSIPSRGSQKLVPESNGTQVVSGSIRVAASDGGTVAAPLAVLSYRPEGITVSEAVMSGLTGTAFRMYVESGGSIQAGLAVANPSSVPVNVTFDLTNSDGSSSGLATSLTIPASGQIAKFLGELFPDLATSFQGVLRMSTGSASEISVMGLRGRYNERGDLLVMPMNPENEASRTADRLLVVPQIASNGGYTLQVTLLGAFPDSMSLPTN